MGKVQAQIVWIDMNGDEGVIDGDLYVGSLLSASPKSVIEAPQSDKRYHILGQMDSRLRLSRNCLTDCRKSEVLSL